MKDLDARREADRILKLAGHAELCDLSLTDPYQSAKQIFAFYVAAGARFRGPPSRRVYEAGAGQIPKSKTAATSGRSCKSCDGPLSKFAAAVCRACYVKAAIERQREKSASLYTRTQEFYDRFSYAASLAEEVDSHFDRYEADFAHDLIEALSLVEVQIGVPCVFWRSLGISSESLDAALEETPPHPEDHNSPSLMRGNAIVVAVNDS